VASLLRQACVLRQQVVGALTDWVVVVERWVRQSKYLRKIEEKLVAYPAID
jgi:hypothetical protein